MSLSSGSCKVLPVLELMTYFKASSLLKQCQKRTANNECTFVNKDLKIQIWFNKFNYCSHKLLLSQINKIHYRWTKIHTHEVEITVKYGPEYSDWFLTGDRYSEVIYVIKVPNGTNFMLVVRSGWAVVQFFSFFTCLIEEFYTTTGRVIQPKLIWITSKLYKRNTGTEEHLTSLHVDGTLRNASKELSLEWRSSYKIDTGTETNQKNINLNRQWRF